MTDPGDYLSSATEAAGEPGAWRATERFAETLDLVRPFGMPPVSTGALVDLAGVVDAVLAQGVPGDLVGCGVRRGGAGFLMADLLRRAGIHDRKAWLFDSFQGMPAPGEFDGEAAWRSARDARDPLHPQNSRVAADDMGRTTRTLELGGYVEIVPGWFDDTLPRNRKRIGRIAVLHVDCYWYASVLCCLEALYDRVSATGFVVFDDYHHYEGCAVAVHEFLGRRRVPHGIESVTGDWAGCVYQFAAGLRKRRRIGSGVRALTPQGARSRRSSPMARA